MRVITEEFGDGRVVSRTIEKETWTGCACIFPGGMACECGERCPCRVVKPSSTRTTPLTDLNPFETSFGL